MGSPIDLRDLYDRFAAAQRARNHSAKTVQHYTSTFKDFSRFLAGTERESTSRSLDSAAMRAFGTWLMETPTRGWRGNTTRSVHGVHGRLRDMRAFTKWLVEENIIEQAPKVVLPKLPDEEFPILSDQQVQLLLNCRHLAAAGPQAIRNRALIALMLDTGIRRSEAAGITWEDVELADHLVRVRGKGNKQRRVPFSTGAAAWLKDWMRVRGQGEEPLFWLTSNGIYSLFRRIRVETGIPLHPHQLRHTCATVLVRNNVDVASVQRILGHAAIDTTLKYLTLSDDDLKRKHAAASPFEQAQQRAASQPPPRRKRLRLG